MNVIIANEQQNQLNNLDVDIIKSITGKYDASEIVEMFKSFFYNKMILDVTALKKFEDIKSYELLATGLDPEKIIFLLPEGSRLCTPNFLSHLIGLGIYNFTTNVNGIKYLLKKSNTLQDVEHIKKMSNIQTSSETGASVTEMPHSNNHQGPKKNFNVVLGVRNITDHAGATTFVYMLKKELAINFGQENVVAIEIDKNDFQLFNDKHMVSVKQNEIQNALRKFGNINIIIIDLNNCNDDSFCEEVYYLIEPSTIKLNRLVRKNRQVFQNLINKKVVLNKSLLLNNDIFDFEQESGIKVFYNMPPLDERKRNAIINDFLSRLEVFKNRKNNSNSNNNSNSTKIFGLFRK